jgi:hypothetical protein
MAGWGKRGGVLAACALLTLSAAAPAAAAERDRSPLLLSQFSLSGTNGYRVQILTLGGTALLAASSGQVQAVYLVPARVAGGRISARFGNLGRVSGGLEVGKAAAGECIEKSSAVLRGSISFQGERGYTRVDARTARGQAYSFNFEECEVEAGSSRAARPGPTTLLQAISRRPGGVAAVEAVESPRRGRTLLRASIEERRGRMRIGRAARAWLGGENSLVSSGPGVEPAFALLRPPKPFSGSATYLGLGPGTSTWTGDLSAWLPGRGEVRFAGPSFASSLCRRRVEDPSCETSPPVRTPPAELLQGSGSHSQLPGAERLSWSRYLRNSASSPGSTP